jgi:hypothetical protein
MSEGLAELLSQLPGDRKLTQDTVDFLNKEIRRGIELNGLQREEVLNLVQLCLDKGKLLPSPFESFWAAIYLDWSEEAKTSEEVKKKLAKLVQTLKANAALASTVSQTVQAIQKERAIRREAMAKLAAAMAESANRNPLQSSKGGFASDTPNAFVGKMQSARLGTGENPTHNLELAVQIADEAVDAYPNSPKVLFEAAGCHQLLAETGKFHSALVRFVHMKQAFSIYQQCLTILANQPYVTLKDYDPWRKGLTELIAKVQKELAVLQEQQERMGS